jgi:hypothetical protein
MAQVAWGHPATESGEVVVAGDGHKKDHGEREGLMWMCWAAGSLDSGDGPALSSKEWAPDT